MFDFLKKKKKEEVQPIAEQEIVEQTVPENAPDLDDILKEFSPAEESEQSAAETETEEVPAEEAPVEEAPVEEAAPAEEAPAEEAPAEE